MKLGLKFGLDTLTRENLQFAQQMGVTHIVVHSPRLGDEGVLDYFEMLRMKKFVDSFGLKLCAIENLPGDHMHPITHATSERDTQLEKICTSIDNMGKVGIKVW